jgi:hypothetical protein
MSQKTLSNIQILEEVRALVRQNRIRWRGHAETRMMERGYERGQVRECLLSGRFVESPIIPNKGGDIQYEFKIGASVDGVAIEVVASLVPETRVVVITVIDPNS